MRRAFGRSSLAAAALFGLVLCAGVMPASPAAAQSYDCTPAGVPLITQMIMREHGTVSAVRGWDTDDCEQQPVNEGQTSARIDTSSLGAPFPNTTLARTKSYLNSEMAQNQSFSACRTNYRNGVRVGPACARRHEGVDFDRRICPGRNCLGATVVAMAPGSVQVNSLGRIGMQVRVTGRDNNGNTLVFDYNHLGPGQVSVRNGASVSPGTTLGRLGQPYRMSPHLDLKIKVGTRRVDPVPFINGRAEGAFPQQNVCADPPAPRSGSSAQSATNALINYQHEKMRHDMVKFIRENAGQLSASLAASDSRATEQNGQFLDRRQQQQAQDAEAAGRAADAAAHMPTISGCQAISGARLMHAASVTTARSVGAGTRGFTEASQNRPGSVGADGTLPSAARRVQVRLATYCDPEALNVGREVCTNRDQERIGLDTDIQRAMLGSETLTEKQEAASLKLIDNIVQPLAPTPLRGATTQSVSGVLAHMERTGADAVQNTAVSALSRMRARRVGDGVTPNWTQSMMGNLGGERPATDSASENEILETMFNARFQDPAWYQRLQQAPGESSQRESAVLNASKAMLAWKTQELLSDWMAIQAAVTARKVDATRRDADFQSLGVLQRGSFSAPRPSQLLPNGEPKAADAGWVP